jgi:hypothetical protein
MQTQVNWLFTTFGQLARRAEVVTIDAAKHPLGWALFFGGNIGDIVQIYDASLSGGPSTTGNYRLSNMSRSLSNGANGTPVQGLMTLVLDPVPASYWT